MKIINYSNSIFSILLSACVLIGGSESAKAATTIVKSTSVVPASAVVKGKKIKFACLKKVPGKTKLQSGKLRFTPLADEIKSLKMKARSSSSAAKSLALVRALEPVAKKICVRKTASVPRPSPTAVPQPTTASRAMFDSAGKLTALGKQYLGLAQTDTAGIDAGEQAWNFSCAGCHSSPMNSLHYPNLLNRVQQEPMFFQVPGTLDEQSLKDIVAYLSRFRINVP